MRGSGEQLLFLECIFTDIQLKYFYQLLSFLRFLQEKNSKWCRKTDERPSNVSQIINPMAYSDSSWKTASESTGVQNIPSSFSLTFCLTMRSSGHRKCTKNSIRKNGMNQIRDICGFVERNLLLEATLVRSFANCDPEWSEH